MGRSLRRCRGWTSVRSGAIRSPEALFTQHEHLDAAGAARLARRRHLRGPARLHPARKRRARRRRGRCLPRRRRSRRWRRPRGRAAAAADWLPARPFRRRPTRANPLQKITPVTEAMLDAPRRRRVADVAPHLRRVRLQPAEEDQQDERRRSAAGVELVAARGPERHDANRPRRRDVRARVRRQGPGARRRDRRSALAVLAPAAAGRPAEPQAQPLDLRHAPLRARPPTSTSSRST